VVCALITGSDEVLLCCDAALMVPTLAAPEVIVAVEPVERVVDCAAPDAVDVVDEARRIDVMSDSWGDIVVVCVEYVVYKWTFYSSLLQETRYGIAIKGKRE
jgi:hypothetical protein